jgi:tetratricopeptide (TPR) repeat protein
VLDRTIALAPHSSSLVTSVNSSTGGADIAGVLVAARAESPTATLGIARLSHPSVREVQDAQKVRDRGSHPAPVAPACPSFPGSAWERRLARLGLAGRRARENQTPLPGRGREAEPREEPFPGRAGERGGKLNALLRMAGGGQGLLGKHDMLPGKQTVGRQRKFSCTKGVIMYIRVLLILSFVLVPVCLLAEEPEKIHEHRTPEQVHEYREPPEQIHELKPLNLSRKRRNLPIWEREDADQVGNLSKAARKVRSSIMAIGTPKVGLATGFVISKKHYLVATNAHVADLFYKSNELFAFPNRFNKVYKVKNIWYHPGVLRINEGIIIRSTDVREGDINTQCPDVAVLQLEGDDDFPDELSLAGEKAITDLFAASVGMIGYPSHDNRRYWPDEDHPVAATFHHGVISRITDFNMNPNAKLLQFIQHTAQSFGGFSGSPIFTPDGHVVALNNSGAARQDRGRVVNLNWGIRVDALWELIAYHELDIPLKIDKDKLSVEHYLKPDPQTEKFKKAFKLVYEARKLLKDKEFTEAIDKCTEAIEEMPNWGTAYEVRGSCYRVYIIYGYDNRTLSFKEQLKYAELSLQDIKRWAEINSSNPIAFITLALSYTNYGNMRNKFLGKNEKDYSYSEEAYKMMTNLIDNVNLNKFLKAEAYNCRAVACYHVRDYKAALSDYDMAIKLDPRPGYYENRARLWRDVGRHDLSDEDLEAAKRLR